MKSGHTLQEIAVTLDRQLKTKKDFVADTRAVNLRGNGLLHIDGIGDMPVNDTAHDQIGARLGIPKKYYDRMRSESPNLLSENVNHWFNANPEKRMLRTMDNRVRAFLSERYRPLDNYDLAQAVLPKIQQMGCTVVSSEITESHFYLKVVTERITAEIKKGDVVQSGLVISNSETGFGSVKVEPLVYRLVCANGMIANDYAMNKYHIGRGGFGDDEGAREFFRNETRLTDDKAFWMKVTDTVDATMTEVKFKAIVSKMQASTEKKIEGNPVKAVEVLSKKLDLSETENGSVLRHLISGGDLTQYGLLNAVTRASQGISDYDRATDFERLGGRVLELPQTEWNAIATAI
jgi:hypothetical protein